MSLKDPWVWQGLIPDGPVKRRAPKNLATANLMFDGPGGLADRDSTLESFLANEVEGPAAKALQEVCNWPVGSGGDIPAALSRYLAWAAARSLPMQALMESWVKDHLNLASEVVEPPPEGLLSGREVVRDIWMLHPEHGRRLFPAHSDIGLLAKTGWYPDMRERSNFLEAVHVQAYYFQARWFPRLKWFTLRAPEGEYFVVADRSVGWAADGFLDAPPSCLRDPSAHVLAPISRNIVLVGRHSSETWQVTAAQINALIACWAHEWVAGPTEATIAAAIEARKIAMA